MQFFLVDDTTGVHHLEHNDGVHIVELSFGFFGGHPRQWLLDIHKSTSFKILALRLGLIKMLKNPEKSSPRKNKSPRLLIIGAVILFFGDLTFRKFRASLLNQAAGLIF